MRSQDNGEGVSRLEVRGLGSAVIRDVSLRLGAGEGLAVVGPSGSGKTSLFRAIADLDPNEGEVLLSGEARSRMPAPEWRRRVAYVPAEPAWWLETAGEHLPEGGAAMAERLGLAPALLGKPVASLSTGERQRLALAAAFARAPQVLLLDEPTSALDEGNRGDVEDAVLEMLADGAALLIASHDPAQVARLGLAVLHMRDGRVEEEE
jgi:phosphate-transporting ATPase